MVVVNAVQVVLAASSGIIEQFIAAAMGAVEWEPEPAAFSEVGVICDSAFELTSSKDCP